MKKMLAAAAIAAAVTLLPVVGGHAGVKDKALTDLITRLYLNHKNLQSVYRDLHAAAAENIAGPDRQLSYIQKTYLFVSEANLVCQYQWELLSIFDYIHPQSRSDYFTLRVKGLRRAIFESRDRVNSLTLYYGFIDSDATRKLLDDAIGLVEANIYTYEQLVETLTPLANPDGRHGQHSENL